MAGYTKLFSSILMSSIWEESTETRLVWVTLLALADQNGHVDGTVKSLARVSRVSLEDCQKALDCLLSPDLLDRSGVAEGRRIVPEQGGWRLVNHATYRAKMSADERRERDKIRKREARTSTVSAGRPQTSEFVRDVSQAEAEAKAEAPQKKTDTERRVPAPIRHPSPLAWDRQHGRHVVGFCSWVCLPQTVFDEFVNRVIGAGAGEQDAIEQVRAWAGGVRDAWAGKIPGDNIFNFWRNEWATTHGSNKPAAAAGIDPLGGVREALRHV